MYFLRHSLQIFFHWIGGSRLWGKSASQRFLSFLGALPFMMLLVLNQFWYRWTFIPDLTWNQAVIIEGNVFIVAFMLVAGFFAWILFVWLAIGLYAAHDAIWQEGT